MNLPKGGLQGEFLPKPLSLPLTAIEEQNEEGGINNQKNQRSNYSTPHKRASAQNLPSFGDRASLVALDPPPNNKLEIG